MHLPFNGGCSVSNNKNLLEMFAFHDEMAQYLSNMSSTYSLSLVTPHVLSNQCCERREMESTVAIILIMLYCTAIWPSSMWAKFLHCSVDTGSSYAVNYNKIGLTSHKKTWQRYIVGSSAFCYQQTVALRKGACQFLLVFLPRLESDRL